jgi:hypothetical protein
MTEQPRQDQEAKEMPPPWSPLSVSLIALLLSPGGAVLTIVNLQRLRVVDASVARQLTIALIGVYVLGITVLFLVSPRGPRGVPSPDSDVTTVLNGGVALASYIVQRQPFHSWRMAHLRTRTSSWIGALGIAFLYWLVTLVALLPLYILLSALPFLAGGAIHL